jgi:hypothetical protein
MELTYILTDAFLLALLAYKLSLAQRFVQDVLITSVFHVRAYEFTSLLGSDRLPTQKIFEIIIQSAAVYWYVK